MQHLLQGNPDQGELVLALEAGDRVIAQGGSMTRMDPGLAFRARSGGLFSALGRVLAGQSLFLGELSAGDGPGRASLAPTLPGTVLHRALEGGRLLLMAGNFLACTADLKLRSRFAGWRSLFSGEGMWRLEASGRGDLWFRSYGAVIEKELDGEELVVDTGHVVAFEETLDYRITGMGNLKSTLFSSEGLVMRFTGRGRLWLQSRTLRGTGSWITPFLRG